MLIATLGGFGERWGEGRSVEDMVKVRRMGWEEYRHEGRIKRVQEIVHAVASWLDQLMTAIDHSIPLVDSAKVKGINSCPNMPYTVKL